MYLSGANDEIEPRDVLEISCALREQLVPILYGGGCDPEILHSMFAGSPFFAEPAGD